MTGVTNGISVFCPNSMIAVFLPLRQSSDLPQVLSVDSSLILVGSHAGFKAIGQVVENVRIQNAQEDSPVNTS
jgi:hypothetical protein